jgi:hypothetical protein
MRNCFLWNLKLLYHVHNNLPLFHMLSQMNPVHIFPPCISKVHYIILTSTPWSSEWSFPFMFSDLNCVYISHFTHACYITRLLHSLWDLIWILCPAWKSDQWNPIRTSSLQSRSRLMRFLGFFNHEKGLHELFKRPSYLKYYRVYNACICDPDHVKIRAICKDKIWVIPVLNYAPHHEDVLGWIYSAMHCWPRH